MKETTNIFPSQNKLAVFVDADSFPWGKKKLCVEHVLQALRPWGRVAIKKAFARNFWQTPFLTELKELDFSLHKVNVCPKRKNGVDIRLTIDVIETVTQIPDIKAVVIVSGDSDFVPLVEQVQKYHKAVIGCGSKRSSSQKLIYTTNIFLFYEDILAAHNTHYNNKFSYSVTEIKSGEEAMKTLLRKRGVYPPPPQMREKILQTLVEISQKIPFPCQWKELQDMWLDTCELWGASRTMVRNTATALIRTQMVVPQTNIPFSQRKVAKIPSCAEMQQAICSLQLQYLIQEPNLVQDPIAISKVVWGNARQQHFVSEYIKEQQSVNRS